MNIERRRFGRLRALALAGTRGGAAYWLCQCDCGAMTLQRGNKLRAGEIVSCGCQRRDPRLKRALRMLLPGARRSAIARQGALARAAVKDHLDTVS